VDLSKLKMTDWLVGGGTLVFLISMFLPWYEAEVEGFGSGSVNGFDYALFGWIPLLLLLAAAAALVLPKLADGVKVPERIGPLPRTQAALIAAALAAVLVLLRIVIKDDGDVPSILDDQVDISRGIGLFLGFLAAAAVTAGAFLKYQGKEDGPSSSPSAPPTPF
jgi:hypothetical protein